MTIWQGIMQMRAEMLGLWCCEDCGVKLTEETTVGRKITYRKHGGTEFIENCKLVCATCDSTYPQVEVIN